MTPLHGIACFYDVGFGARAVSRKTPIYFMNMIMRMWIEGTLMIMNMIMRKWIEGTLMIMNMILRKWLKGTNDYEYDYEKVDSRKLSANDLS